MEAVLLGYFAAYSLDPLMWLIIIICTWFFKNKTFISAIISTVVYVGGWGIIFRIIVLDISSAEKNIMYLIMSTVTTLFWGLIVGYIWNRKRRKSDSNNFKI